MKMIVLSLKYIQIERLPEKILNVSIQIEKTVPDIRPLDERKI